MPHLHTGLATHLFVDNEGNNDRTLQTFLIVWNGSEGEIPRSVLTAVTLLELQHNY